jgi:phosphoribosylformylglycinamidine synthase
MWEFAEATRGLADAARELETPVVSGNVSFYNETKGSAIFPTPTIGMLGLLEDWERHAAAHFAAEGLAIVLLGENREDLAGSEWLLLRRGLEAGLPAPVDLAHERRLHALLATLVAAGLAPTAHDVADGGLAVALCESAFGAPRGIGARVELVDRIRPDALLFGEAPGRVLVATAAPDEVLRRAREAGVPAREIGRTGGERLVIGPVGGPAWIDAPLERLRAIWAEALPGRMEER